MVSKPSAFLLVRGKQKPNTKKAQHCSASVCQLLVHDGDLATNGYGDVTGVGRIWEGFSGTRNSYRLLFNGTKIDFIQFRITDPIQSYLTFKTAYFICFWQLYILLSYKVNERKSRFNENYKREIPHWSLFFVVIWPKEKALRFWILIKAHA